MDMLVELQGMGLTEYEAKVYLALVKFGVLSAKEVSERSGVPSNRVYETALALQRYGFVDIVPGKPKRFKAFAPDAAIREWLAKKREEVELLGEQSKSLVKVLREMESKKGPLKTGVWITGGGRKAIAEKRNELISLAKKGRKAVISATRLPETMRLKVILSESEKKGIDTKLIFAPNPGIEEFVKFSKKTGANVRFYPMPLHMKFGIIDSKLAYIESTDGPEENWFLIWTDSFPIVQMLDNYFEMLWRAAKA